MACVMARIWASVNDRARRTPVPAGAEDHPLSGVIHVGPARIVLAFELGQVHQHFLGGRLACEW